MASLNVEFEKRSWAHATLPPAAGGIGLCSATLLSLPHFRSSYCASRELSSKVLGCTVADRIDERFDTSLSASRTARSGAELPSGEAACRTRYWAAHLARATASSLLHRQNDFRCCSRACSVGAAIKRAIHIATQL